MSSNMQPRVEGQTAPGTAIYWPERTGPNATEYVDLSSASGVKVECSRAGRSGLLWTKTTGIVAQAGSASVPSAQITWSGSDLGGLTAGTYKLELSCTVGGVVRKLQLDLVVTPELV